MFRTLKRDITLLLSSLKSVLLTSITVLLMSPLACYATSSNIEELLFEALDKERDRVVPIKVYFNKSKASQPIILFSHGLGGSRENNAYLGKYWAEAGYVSVFMQHKGSDIDVWKSVRIGKRLQALKSAASAETALLRFNDVPFIIDQLKLWNNQQGHQLNKLLDLEHIGMSGHSFGAITTLAVAGRKFPLGLNFYDPRIDAFLALSPSSGESVKPSEVFRQIKSPILCMTGSEDESPISNTSPEDRLKVYEALPKGDKYQLVLEGAKHFAFGDNNSWRTRGRNPKHHSIIQQISLQFWNAYLKGNTESLQWLQSNKAITETGLISADVWQWK